MRKGNLRAAGFAIALAMAAFGLLGCGSGSGGADPTTTGPPVSAATAGHLAKLSDRIATDLDGGDTCSAAHAADDLAAAVQDAHLSTSLRSGVDGVTSRLVDEVNCPPPPPPPEPKKLKPEKDHGKPGEHGGETHAPPGHIDHGGFVPPGQAKLKGE